MNKSAFLKLIKQVADISDQQQSELEQVAATFPYCQTAHLLLAKSAYDRGSMLSTQRLRRASAYATDRQLLKRLIYTSPVLEPAYADETDVAQAETTEVLPLPHADANTTAASTTESEKTAESDIPEEDTPDTATPEIQEAVTDTIPDKTTAQPEEEAETLEQVYHHTSAENTPFVPLMQEEPEEQENPAAEIDSELALLFTFSSISSSSTDLLSQRPQDTGIAHEDEATADSMHLAETAEVLNDLNEASEPTTSPAIAPIEATDSIPDVVPDALDSQTVLNETVIPLQVADDSNEQDGLTDFDEPTTAAEAEIKYSFDEMDRLYAEDALGYWMGSSRMGEVLQLKDEYTRPRPQSFHPELILEYSRTHELEKAIQPTKHVLSKQLDIIDQFLKLNPRLKTMANLKLKPEPQEDLSLKSSKIKKGMATESLANIFIQQGKAKKAIKIYEQLILKYPEKKSYFAEQIEKLQNIT